MKCLVTAGAGSIGGVRVFVATSVVLAAVYYRMFIYRSTFVVDGEGTSAYWTTR